MSSPPHLIPHSPLPAVVGTPELKTPVISDYPADFETTKQALSIYNPEDADVIKDGETRKGLYVDINFKGKVDSLETKTKNLENSLELLKQDNEVLKQDNEVLKQDNEVFKQAIKDLQKVVVVLQKDNEVLKQDVEVLKEKVEANKTMLETINHEFHASISTVFSMISPDIENQINPEAADGFKSVVEEHQARVNETLRKANTSD